MNISILCSDPRHPVVPWLQDWVKTAADAGHVAAVHHDKSTLNGGDVLFLVSCSQIVTAAERSHFRHVLVLHASDLPKGRGWSPHIWSILEGSNEITVCLLEAADPVDTGDIWLRDQVVLRGDELHAEINDKLFATEMALMSRFLLMSASIKPVAQRGEATGYRRRRTPEDSRLDPQLPLAAQFDLLRVSDPVRYPAFFDLRGSRYRLRIEKVTDDD